MFDHVALNVSNAKKSREFYEHALKPMGIGAPPPSRIGRGSGKVRNRSSGSWSATR